MNWWLRSFVLRPPAPGRGWPGAAALGLTAALSAAVLAAGPPPAPFRGPGAAPVSPLVRVQAGELPVIISAPHGGTLPVPGVPERKGEDLMRGPRGFFTGRDTGTEEVALEVARAIEAKLGQKPYFVVARFHRKFIDANRPPRIAYESDQAKPTYDAYHGALVKACREVQAKFGRGLLLDLHGQGTARDTIFRGTQNGQTVTLLRQRFGPKATDGPASFFGLLEAEGCTVFPTKAGVKERAGFTGGFIVQTYGSHETFGIDALQLEMGADYRSKDAARKTGERLASVVAAYRKLYLPAEPKAAP